MLYDPAKNALEFIIFEICGTLMTETCISYERKECEKLHNFCGLISSLKTKAL